MSSFEIISISLVSSSGIPDFPALRKKNLFWGLLLFVLAELCFLFISLVVSGKQRMANKFLGFFIMGAQIWLLVHFLLSVIVLILARFSLIL